jgi:hypothetical protein
MRKAELLATLNQFLIEQYASGRKVLLILDEAQNLSNKVLEEVRLLSGVETTKEKVLRIILAGQPELNDKLDSQDLVQLRQRVRLRFHLNALSEPDTTEYIKHRLRVAGAGDRELFEPDTFPVIYRYTGGIPRLTNTLCDTALLAAFASDHATVGMEDLKSAVTELQWVEYVARTSTQQRPGIDDTAPQEMPPVGRLVLSLKGLVTAETYLVPGRYIIGRTTDNDLQVDSRFVSRHHAQVVTTTQGSWIEDLNSTNGIFVRGKRVRRHKLVEGDVVQIGQHSLTYSRADVGGSTVAMDREAEDADEDESVAAEDEREG